ncbi:serine protease easter-like [Coccinella septempunctata]|uniref:serine protease easter-like n=1 Tax=Coccinella septempunctata TaxID=41139 RepID=UPI001D075B53|nr:serine protease easter-like [Coccinella septempunctata]
MITHPGPRCKGDGDICIDIFECPYFVNLLEVTKKTRPHFVIQEMRKNQCGFVDDHPKVCCTPSQLSRSEMKEEHLSGIQHDNLQLLPLDTCGNVRLYSRITNGENPQLGQFPWMAMLFYTTSNGPDFLCGGSLISDKYVLTAAHCIHDNILGVRVGEFNIITSKDCQRNSGVCAPPHQDFHIDTIVMHPEYDKKTQSNDIALIRLSVPADMNSDYVGPICLPLWNSTNPDGATMTVAGWGMTENGYKSPILKKAEVPEVPLDTCRKIFHHYAEILDTQICAGGKRKDSCSGDSGGPLFNIATGNGRARYVQAGIVSFGPKNCGTFGLPGIYTRVQSYVDWILNQLQP